MFRLLSKKPSPAPASSGLTARERKALEPSVIAANMNVLGNIVSDGILDIDGQIDGNVRAEVVTLRPNGRIRGDLVATEAFVHGTVDGLIKAQAVNVFAGAVVRGTIMHESLTIEDGAQVDGKLKRSESGLTLSENTETGLTNSPAPSADFAAHSAVAIPSLDSTFMNDNDEPQSEAEIKILENLRLIS
jgi:cytoskeletal protein CcmA (bactofilin family)